MSLFFLVEQTLKAVQVLLHVSVDLEIPRYNFLHLLNVLIDVTVLAVSILIL